MLSLWGQQRFAYLYLPDTMAWLDQLRTLLYILTDEGHHHLVPTTLWMGTVWWALGEHSAMEFIPSLLPCIHTTRD